jgi:AcrR family transcriptional regulator
MEKALRDDWAETLQAAKQAAILNAACRVFEEHGLERATMREIAARAGVTTGAIYPVFPSKEALYAALLKQSLQALANAVERASHRPRRSEKPHEAAARAFLEYYLERPFEVNLGLYAFHGLKRQGVGRSLSNELDAALVSTVRRLSPDPGHASNGLPDAGAMQVFVHLIGLLTLELSGRLQIGRSSARTLLQAFLHDISTTREKRRTP